MWDVFEYTSWLENEHSSNINDFVNKNKYRKVSIHEVDDFLQKYHIEYHELPQYLKDKIDELDIY